MANRAAVVCRLRTDAGYTVADNRATMANAAAESRRRGSTAARCGWLLPSGSSEPIELSSLRIGPVRHPSPAGRVHDRVSVLRPAAACPTASSPWPPTATAARATSARSRRSSEGGYEPTDSLVAPQSESILKTAIRQLLGVE